MIIIRTYPAPEGKKWIKEIIDDGSIIWRKNTAAETVKSLHKKKE